MNVPRRMEIGAGMIGPCDANPPPEEAKAIVEDTEAKARAMADVDAGILERLARKKIRNLYRRSVYRCRARALGRQFCRAKYGSRRLEVDVCGVAQHQVEACLAG